MTRTLSTALVALTLGFGGMAVAQDSQLQIGAQNTLERYGYEGVNVEMLSTEQLALFQTYFGSDPDLGEVGARHRIDEILMMEEGTTTYISPDMQAMFDDTSQLELNARTLLDLGGFEEVDVSTLTTQQLAQLWFVQERSDVMNSPVALRNFIEVSVLDAS
jgi:hypothetical protein